MKTEQNKKKHPTKKRPYQYPEIEEKLFRHRPDDIVEKYNVSSKPKKKGN